MKRILTVFMIVAHVLVITKYNHKSWGKGWKKYPKIRKKNKFFSYFT